MYTIADLPAPLDPARHQRLLECETATIGHFREEGFIDPEIRCQLDAVRVAGVAVTLSLPPGDGSRCV